MSVGFALKLRGLDRFRACELNLAELKLGLFLCSAAAGAQVLSDFLHDIWVGMCLAEIGSGLRTGCAWKSGWVRG